AKSCEDHGSCAALRRLHTVHDGSEDHPGAVLGRDRSGMGVHCDRNGRSDRPYDPRRGGMAACHDHHGFGEHRLYLACPGVAGAGRWLGRFLIAASVGGFVLPQYSFTLDDPAVLWVVMLERAERRAVARARWRLQWW